MVHLLVDVVSKNGNLLLNIPLPGHGRPDDDELTFIDKFGAWMALNSEAIYATRPWKIDGEGPTKAGVSLYGGRRPRFAAGDLRFTTKGDTLYAIALAWPDDRKLVIKSLAADSPHYRGEIAKIGLLGSESNLVWSRSTEGVTVNLPEKPPCDYAVATPPGGVSGAVPPVCSAVELFLKGDLPGSAEVLPHLLRHLKNIRHLYQPGRSPNLPIEPPGPGD